MECFRPMNVNTKECQIRGKVDLYIGLYLLGSCEK